MTIRANLIPNIKGDKGVYKPRNSNAEAEICLNCTLPASACDKVVCKRYKEKMKNLQEKRKWKKRN